MGTKIIRREKENSLSTNQRRNEILRIFRGRPNSCITKGELANILETPERDIQRDIAALIADYIPIQIKEGRGGGYIYIGSKYARFLSTEHVETLKKAIQRAKDNNDSHDMIVLQGLIDAYS